MLELRPMNDKMYPKTTWQQLRSAYHASKDTIERKDNNMMGSMLRSFDKGRSFDVVTAGGGAKSRVMANLTSADRRRQKSGKKSAKDDFTPLGSARRINSPGQFRTLGGKVMNPED